MPDYMKIVSLPYGAYPPAHLSPPVPGTNFAAFYKATGARGVGYKPDGQPDYRYDRYGNRETGPLLCHYIPHVNGLGEGAFSAEGLWVCEYDTSLLGETPTTALIGNVYEVTGGTEITVNGAIIGIQLTLQAPSKDNSTDGIIIAGWFSYTDTRGGETDPDYYLVGIYRSTIQGLPVKDARSESTVAMTLGTESGSTKAVVGKVGLGRAFHVLNPLEDSTYALVDINASGGGGGAFLDYP